jgi:hypothetical protein
LFSFFRKIHKVVDLVALVNFFHANCESCTSTPGLPMVALVGLDLVNMSTIMNILSKRQHIQDHANADKVIYYWGYSSRVVPCVNDAVSCSYLDSVYSSHTTSMLYSFVLWAVIGAFFIVLVLLRVARPTSKRQSQLNHSAEGSTVGESYSYRVWRAAHASAQRLLLPEGLLRWFGHVTRLQLLILTIITVYLTIFRYAKQISSQFRRKFPN